MESYNINPISKHMHPKKNKDLSLGLGFGFEYFADLLQISK